MSDIPLRTADTEMDDGRNIDLAIGGLSGEGASQLTHGKTQREPGTRALWSRMPESSQADPTYYDWPMLKEPVWEWEIPLYYYLGGLAGTSVTSTDSTDSADSIADD